MALTEEQKKIRDLELENALDFLEKTTSFRRAYPNNKFSNKTFYGIIDKKMVYIKIDNKDYTGEVSYMDRNKNCIVFINGIKYSFVYPGDREEVVMTRIY